MKEVKSIGKKLIKKSVKAIVRQEMAGWPPTCYGFTYQPIRPTRKTNKEMIDKG